MVKKLAVLVGCNYKNTRFKLRGCVNDVVAMKEVLETIYGFDPTNIKVLVVEDLPETPSPADLMPTGANIKAALNQMVDKAEEGDVLFFHFSGHGTIPSSDSDPAGVGDAFNDEAIVPCDLNLITDMDLRQLIMRLPDRSSFTILSDSCHSGRLIDKSDKEQIGASSASTVKNNTTPPDGYKARGIAVGTIHQRLQSLSSFAEGSIEALLMMSGRPPITDLSSLLNSIFKNDVSIRFRPPNERDPYSTPLSEYDHRGILLSGCNCQAKETSVDIPGNETSGGKPHGAFTNAVVQILKETKEQGAIISNKQLVMEARKRLKDHNFEQHPCLYCSDGIADAPFLGNSTLRP